MDIITILFIAIGLAMDCTAVSISKGICVKRFHLRYSLRMALILGFFQGGMPVIGYFVGASFGAIISRFDHWIAFILLLVVGGKMIIESFHHEENEEEGCSCENQSITHHFRWSLMITLAFATNIDALATGLIFVPYPDILWQSVAIIGMVSFFFSLLGMYIGTQFGKRFKLNVNLIGGIILVCIGAKILIGHLASIG